LLISPLVCSLSLSLSLSLSPSVLSVVCINVVCAASCVCFGGGLSPAHPILMLPAATEQQHTTDDVGSSAECSSDDEDLEECETGHAGGLG